MLFLSAAYIIHDGRCVKTTSYTFESDKLPGQFDGFKIALVSDFHNSDNYDDIIREVRNIRPSIICITGDLVSMETTDYSNARNLADGLMNIAQVYYTYGNHEYYNATYHNVKEPPIKKELDGTGVIFLNNASRTLKRNGALLNLVGYGDSVNGDGGKAFLENAKPFMKKISGKLDKNVVSILMMHRTQYFDEISKYPFDLVLGGHLHGGQIGIKPIQSRILKKHVFTDKYSKGEYFQNGHEMIISGGCANNDGIRIFNSPEVVSIVLKRTEN